MSICSGENPPARSMSASPLVQRPAPAYDILIIGSGPGGYVTAIRAAQLGFKTAIVEREHLGGICLNWGCIPTKALLRSAEIFHYAEACEGLRPEDRGQGDLRSRPIVVKRSRAVSAQLNGGVGFLMKKNKVDVIWGEAVLEGAGKVKVAPRRRSRSSSRRTPSRKACWARGRTGQAHHRRHRRAAARAARHRAGRQADLDLFRGDEARGDAEIADRHGLGRHRHRIRLLLPHHGRGGDGRRGAAAGHAGRGRGDRRRRAQAVREAGHEDPDLDQGHEGREGREQRDLHARERQGREAEIKAERLISAVGVVGNIENLGLEALGVKTDRGCIVIDGFGRTNVPGLYAIGDVAGPPMLAHKAEHEGVICVETIKGLHVARHGQGA
jgi:dihydrolipoamide dehydrogenase